jgi:O-antigen/teichoic acid export membrane protein
MWGSKVLLLVPQLILVPYLIGTIGEAGYGVYALIWPLMMSIDQLEITLQQGVVKYSAAFLAQDEINKVNKIISSSFVCSLIVAAMLCLSIFTAAVGYKDSANQIGTSLFVVGVMVLFIVPLTPYIAVIQSQRRYYVNAISDTISKYTALLLVVAWFYLVRPSVEALIIIMASTLFLSRIIQVPIAYRLIPGLCNHPRLFDWAIFRLIVSFGAITVLVALCLALNSTGIRWLMGSLVSTVFVAQMAIMLMPGMLLMQVIGVMTITVMPVTSACEATGDFQVLKDLLVRGMRYTTIMVFAGLLAACLLMKDVLTVWVGAEYAFLTPYSLSFFASTAFMLSTSVAHHMLKGLGKLKSVLFIYFISFVIIPFGLIIGIFFIWETTFPAVTFGLTLGNLVCGILNAVYGIKSVQLSWGVLVKHVYGPPIILVAIVALITLGFITLSGIQGLLAHIIVAFSAVLMFLGGCYSFVVTASDRLLLKEYCSVIFKKAYVNDDIV